MSYALKAVMYTHPENTDSPDIAKKYIRFGASPRAAQSIVNSARVRALLEGRYNVSFDDIKYVAYPSLRHRIFMNYEGIAEGMDVDDLIKNPSRLQRSKFSYGNGIFEPEFLKRLERLSINMEKLTAAGSGGLRKSRAKGNSVEFSDFREYAYGDDLESGLECLWQI